MLQATLFATALVGCDPDVQVTVFVVRHAEKQKPAASAPSAAKRDPPLSDKGGRRAQALAAALKNADLHAIYSSQYKRTRQTVAPTAEETGLVVEIVDAGDVGLVVDKICARQAGAVLVSGHSNTVPQIIDKLGVSERVKLAEGDYGDLFVVRPTGSAQRLERRRFDPGS